MKFKFIDKERELKYSLGEILSMHKRFEGHAFTLLDIAEVALVGLQHDEPELTKEAVANFINVEDEEWDALLRAIRKACALDRPKRPTPAADPNISGPSPATTSESVKPSSTSSPPSNSGRSSHAGKPIKGARTPGRA